MRQFPKKELRASTKPLLTYDKPYMASRRSRAKAVEKM